MHGYSPDTSNSSGTVTRSFYLKLMSNLLIVFGNAYNTVTPATKRFLHVFRQRIVRPYLQINVAMKKEVGRDLRAVFFVGLIFIGDGGGKDKSCANTLTSPVPLPG